MNEHVPRPDLERGPRPVPAPGGVVAEARVEEPGVVGAQLARGRVVGKSSRLRIGADADALGGEEQVEDLGLEHDPPMVLRAYRLPELAPAVATDSREVDREAVLLRPIADHAVRRSRQIDAEEQPVGD